MAAGKWTDAAEHSMGGKKSAAPKKEIKSIEVSKSHNGGHVMIHKHHHPDHHPDETHTTHGDDAMAEHMMANAGTPNPGEAADPTMQGAAPMTAAPSGPAPSGPTPTGAPGM